MSKPQTQHDLEQSDRFHPPKTRRDFLGLAAIWSFLVALGVAAIGAIRLPMPAVFPESNAKVKVGQLDRFAKGSITHLPHLNAWMFRDEKGLYAISAVCTHLGCITNRDSNNGEFFCPCHGSVFRADGKVLVGPAPSSLHWLVLSLAPDGQVVVNQRKTVPLHTRLEV